MLCSWHVLLLQGRGRKRGVNKGRDGLGWSSVDHGNPEVSFDCLLVIYIYIYMWLIKASCIIYELSLLFRLPI